MSKNSIFNYRKFDDFLENEIEKNTNLKRGEKKEIAEYINIHPTLLSQILSGTRRFTDEQVFLLGEYLGLTELESEYVFVLHQIEATQNKKFLDRLIAKRDALKNRSTNLSERVEKDRALSDNEKAVYYSSWQYSAIRIYSSIGEGKSRDEIYNRLLVDKKQTSEILDFLVSSGLCKLEKGKYYQTVGRTHLEKSSPYLKQHHANWRIKAIQKMDKLEDENLNFTAPLSLSNKDFEYLREEMVKLIKKVSDTVKDTEAEDIFCFTIDFFRV